MEVSVAVLGQIALGSVGCRGAPSLADVGTGDYLGRCVPIKSLRFWAQDVPNKVFKMLDPHVLLLPTPQLAVSSENHSLGVSFPF